jgi:hypothetical protein
MAEGSPHPNRNSLPAIVAAFLLANAKFRRGEGKPVPQNKTVLVGLKGFRVTFELEHVFSYTTTLAAPEIIGPVPDDIRVNSYVTGGDVWLPDGTKIGNLKPNRFIIILTLVEAVAD